MFVKVKNDSDSDSDSDTEALNPTTMMGRKLKNALDIPISPKLEVPLSVKAVITRIEQAQLSRAREEINMQLNSIMNNVRRVINRYNFVDITSTSARKSSLIEYKKKRRSIFLEKMATHAKAMDIREKTLAHILAWFEEWNAILSEITAIDIDEHHHWIAQMELLPDTLKAIEANVKILCKTSTSFLEEKKKQKKKILSRGTLWKSWKDRVIKRPATAHALRPDQMISDQFTTNTKVSEIQDMLQELTGTTMFNKLENNAIKYISSTVLNLYKALIMLNDELKVINLQSSNTCVDETAKADKELSLKIMQDLSEQNEMLQQKLQDAEEKFEQILRSKLVTGQLVPTFITLTGGSSPQPSMAKAGDTDSMENILAKEFENVDETQRKGIKSTVIKWDSAVSYTAQGEMTPGITEQASKDVTGDKMAPQKDDAYHKDVAGQYRFQKRRHTKGPHPHETSEPRLSIGKGEQKVLEAKPSQYSELQALEKKRKEMKPISEIKVKAAIDSKSTHSFSTEVKSQDGKGEISSLWERTKKIKPMYLLGRRTTPLEPTTESVGTETKGKMGSPEEPFQTTQPVSTSEPQKVEIKGRKHQVFPGTSKGGTTEEKEMLSITKQVQPHLLMKSHSRIAKDSYVSPDVKSEQVKLELFQKAILAFLKSKIDSIGRPLDKESVLKEEELLKTAEIQKLETIKAKTEEYFQKVAEAVIKALRKYKDLKNEDQFGEKLLKQEKITSLIPELPFQRPSVSPKSKFSSFLLNEGTDPVVNNLIQMILDESERDEKGHKKEKRKQKAYLQESPEEVSSMSLKHQMQEEHLSKESYEMRNKYLGEKKVSHQMKERKQEEQKRDQWQEEKTWNEDDQRIQIWVKQDKKHKQRGREEEQPKTRRQQLEERKQIVREQGLPSKESEEMMRQVPKELRLRDLEMTGDKDEEKQKPEKGIEDLKKQRQIKAKDQMKTKENKTEDLAKMVTQSPITLAPRRKSLLKYDPKLSQRTKTQRNIKKLKSLLDRKHITPVTPPTSTRPSPLSRAIPVSEEPLREYPRVTPEQAQAPGITPIPKQVQAIGIPSISKRSQSLEVTVTPEQTQALRASLTPEHIAKLPIPFTPKEAQKLETTLTREQVQAPRVPIMLQQAPPLRKLATLEKTEGMQIPPMAKQTQILGIPSTQEGLQSLNINLTAQQAPDLGITFTPKQAQEPGITLTPKQAQTQGITLTPKQAQELGITLTPKQAQELGITLTPQQPQESGITFTPQQAQEPGITLTPKQAQTQGITLTPKQAQELGITLTPKQAQELGITLTPQQPQELGITLTPQQAQELGITLNPQQPQDLGITLTPQQAQELGITLTPQQAQIQGITLTPQQAQELGITFTPQQGQELGNTLTPQQAQELGITLTPQQAQELGITLTPQQPQTQGITLTPQQAQKLGITLTPQQPQTQGIILTPQQAHELGVTLTPQQAQDLGITLTPQQPQTQGITLTPQQAQELGITLTPQQPQTQGITLTPQQAHELGVTLTPQQAQTQGITLTPQKSHELGITLTPQQAQTQGITLTPQQAQELGIILTPQQAQELGITLTPQQAQTQGISLTPQQAQELGITLTPQQPQTQGITLTPQQAQELGITLTPQQAQIQGITPTPQQAQELGITLTPQQAQTQGITLTPQQAQELGITLTRQQPQTQGITLTPQHAQELGITLTPQQAQIQGITPTPQQAQELEITLTPQQAQIQGITPTPQQAQELGITLTPQQAQTQWITLTPQHAQELGITLTPQQAQTQGITLTSQQAQELGITLTPQQAQELGITLTPQQAQESGITLTPQQARELGITPTPQQARELRITLTPQQGYTQGITLTPQQAQAFGTTVTQEQVEALWPPLTSGRIQSLQDHFAPDQAQELMFSVTPEKAHTPSITLTHEQARALGITLSREQAQALKIPLTEEQAWKLGISVTPEKFQGTSNTLSPKRFHALEVTPPHQQARTLSTSLTLEKPATWAPFTLRPFQELASLPVGQSTTSKFSSSHRQSLPSFAPTAEKPIFGISVTPLQKSCLSLTQAPFAPGKHPEIDILSDPGKLLSPQILPASRQILVGEGQPIPEQSLTPEIPPTPGQLPIFGASPTAGQPLELEALSSRRLVIPRFPLAPQPPLISQTPLTPRKPLVSTAPSTSGQISRLWAPLSPGKPFVPGDSSITGELLEYRSLAFAEQPEAFQPPATPEQTSYRQTPSAPGPPQSPWLLPGQSPPLEVGPIPRHPSTQWAPPASGKPQRGLPSSVTQEKLEIISSLKSKPALVHPSPDLKVFQAPFIPKKVQISEVSDASEETQMLRDTFAMEATEGVQSYPTDYRTRVSQTPYIRGEAFYTPMKPKTSLPSLIIQQPKIPQILPSEREGKSWFPPIDKPWILPSVSGMKKPMMVPPSSPQDLEEKRYFVDVEAQRKNLILLSQAIKTSRLPLQHHLTARNLIIETLHMDTVRLGYLFRKYIAYRLIQRARNNIIKRLKAIQNTGKGYETRNLYIMLSRLDDYQKKVMRIWTEKQKSLEQKRNQCLRKMTHLFSQLQEMYGLNLSQPIPLIIGKKQIPSSPRFVQRPLLQLLMEEDKKSDIFKKFRRQDQLEAIWNADLSTSSYPITEKTSMHSLWAQLGGYPDIPKLLQLDIQSTFRKSLASIQAQSKKIPK